MTGAFNFDINPGLADEPDRQTGSVAPLDYLEDVDTGLGGVRPNLTQINDPDYPDAILLAPSTDFGFEGLVFIRPDHDFLEAPGPGGRMIIGFDANPVHGTSGVQATGDAPIVVRFVQLEFQLFDDGGHWGVEGRFAVQVGRTGIDRRLGHAVRPGDWHLVCMLTPSTEVVVEGRR